jgi:excisionase family DNA binding protein
MRARRNPRPCISGEARTAAIRIVRGSGGNALTLMTVTEVAEFLRVPLSWVYDHVRPGCRDPLPHVKLGKYLRFRSSDIDAYIKSIVMNGRRG